MLVVLLDPFWFPARVGRAKPKIDEKRLGRWKPPDEFRRRLAKVRAAMPPVNRPPPSAPVAPSACCWKKITSVVIARPTPPPAQQPRGEVEDDVAPRELVEKRDEGGEQNRHPKAPAPEFLRAALLPRSRRDPFGQRLQFPRRGSYETGARSPVSAMSFPGHGREGGC